ncbi:MAG TPA: class I SAM-dependent methyltransferase [Solirubrobacteraceae bacterium]|nr:class I SAM-dependent methyltransferase [Solirubrobacteraceae bacterium]
MNCSLRDEGVRRALDRLQGEPEFESSITPEVGELIYMLTLTRRAALIVEFGGLVGYSTIYLASALADLGSGQLITTELDLGRADRIRENLADAGVAQRVDVRPGDAMLTLQDLAAPIDLLFLDGLNDLYLPLLQALEPHLEDHAVVVADLSSKEPLSAYRAYVTDPLNGYASVTVGLDDGVLVSVR